MPKYDTIRKGIQYARNELSQAPPNPISRNQLVIPESYKRYEGELFLLIDTGAIEPDEDRILVFGRESYAAWADRVTNIYVDGTFSVCFKLILVYKFKFSF